MDGVVSFAIFKVNPIRRKRPDVSHKVGSGEHRAGFFGRQTRLIEAIYGHTARNQLDLKPPQLTEYHLVAEGGFEPPTKGLSIRGVAVDEGACEVGLFIGGYVVFNDGDAAGVVVIDEGPGAEFEGGEFAADGGERVVDTAAAVAAGVAADTLEDGVGRAEEVDEVGDADDVVDGGGLAEMSWEAVEDDDVVVAGGALAEEGA